MSSTAGPGPWRFGETVIERVLEFDGVAYDPFVLMPELTPALLDEHAPWLTPVHLNAERKAWLSFHSFVIRTPRTITVVDTCGGNDKNRPQRPRYHMQKHPYLERLAAIGVQPEDVDFVLCTHLHADHVGWNTRWVDGRWVPTFPRAKYLVSKIEWDYWADAINRHKYVTDPYYEDSLVPVMESGQVVFTEGGYPIDQGVMVERWAGHTPGHLCVRVAGGGREAVMSGDLMHHAMQIAAPELNSCFCVDEAAARATRLRFLAECAERDALIMPGHFPAPTAGRVTRRGSGYFYTLDAGER